MEITSQNYGINREKLKEFVLNNPRLVTRKESKRYPGLSVLKYTRNVFFKNLWDQNEMLRHCRGLVVDADFNVIQLPFKKIYNYQENGAGVDWHPRTHVGVSRKVNGFMASLSVYNGKLLIGTTGSLDSDFVGYAETYLKDIDPSTLCPETTYMFEICHPDDPHIIPEKSGAYLLSIIYQGTEFYSFDNARLMLTYDDSAFQEIAKYAEVSEWYESIPDMRFEDAVKMAREAPHEGYVIYNYIQAEMIKIKSKAYLFQKMLARKSDIMSLNMERVEEEFYPLIEKLRKDELFKVMPEQDRLEYMRNLLNSTL
jgi:hypothetical protein